MRQYTEDDYETILTISYNHGGIEYAGQMAAILGTPQLELFMVESKGFIGKYEFPEFTMVLATKEDNTFTLNMWKYIKKVWLSPKKTTVITVIDNHSQFDRLLSTYNSGYRIRNLLINPKET